MELFTFLGLSILFFSYFKMFNKKLMVLLIMEFLMLYIILFFLFSPSSDYFSSFVGLILSVFMVLDSVFGVSFLISSGRMSSSFGSNFFLI